MQWIFVVWMMLGATATAAQPNVSFERQVRPLLTRHCLKCHGPQKRESGLRVDRPLSLLRGGDSGKASVVPGKRNKSLLFLAVSGRDPDLKMPPTGKALNKKEVAIIGRWIDQGAKMKVARTTKPWSLLPIRRNRPPRLQSKWLANPIDAFVLARLREKGLTPSSPANRVALLQRVSHVMHGLPPTPALMQRWQSGKLTYAQLVEEMLRSPRYGERWAQHWLDVIRWAETWGFETNRPRDNAWQYRDWVIRALNRDLPYDRFVLAQIAGDTIQQDAATGFLVSGPANLPGQIGKDEPSMRQARQDELDEVVRTVGAAFLAMTIGCARCHSHKFDPIEQRDYYSLQAVFAGLRYGHRRQRGKQNDQWTAKIPAAKRKVERLTARLAAEQKRLKLLPPIQPARHRDNFQATTAKAVRVWIDGTHSGQAASLYELEVLSATQPATNVAAAQRGGSAKASSFALENQTRHPDNLIDGLFQKDGRWPWIAAKDGPAWVKVTFPRPVSVNAIVWQQGFRGVPVDYRVEVLAPSGKWQQVYSSRRRMLWSGDARTAKDISLTNVSTAEVARLVNLLKLQRQASSALNRLQQGPQVFAGMFGQPTDTYRLYRGDVMQRRGTVLPNVPRVLGRLQLKRTASDRERRLALAGQIVSKQNPLTARVMVNRIWQHHFGTGLVDTPSDFGRMGSKPTHPRLLDWLASEFMQGQWSIKHIHRLILHSNTFRQASRPNRQATQVDADSRLLWRFPPRRLEAEAIRDSILAVSGKLNLTMHGEGFDFFNQKGGLSDYISKKEFDQAGWRRMIYATKIRMQRVDIFGLLDCPDAGQMTPRRTRSITPIQALSLFNSDFVLRQARFFAQRVRKESPKSTKQQVAHAAWLALGRKLTPQESSVLTKLADDHGLTQVCRVLFNANEFIFLE